MRRKTTVKAFQVTNKQNLTREDIDKTKKGNLKIKTESQLKAAKNNAIRTNHFKSKINNTQKNCKFKLSDVRDKTINHIIREYYKLDQS